MKRYGLIALMMCYGALSLAAEPIDTQQFGFLHLGMPAATVRARVGAPDMIRPLFTSLVPTRLDGKRVLVTHSVVLWVYNGGGERMDTYLTFDNDCLVAKEKRR